MTPTTFDKAICDGASLPDIASFLDGLDDPTRQSTMLTLSSTAQQVLYKLALDGPDLDLTYFLPNDVEQPKTIAHRGFNTLPLPTSGKKFTKWMTRGPDGSVIGYNDSPFGVVLGPGYFVLRETPSQDAARGAVVVDYYITPEGPVPAEWPWLRANWVGLQILVYHRTRDYMRRVSKHVTIGSAFKFDKELGSYFVLCRQDPAQSLAPVC